MSLISNSATALPPLGDSPSATSVPSTRSGSSLDNMDAPATFKELVDKLAWAVGTSMHVRYCKRTKARDWAIKMASELYELKDWF